MPDLPLPALVDRINQALPFTTVTTESSAATVWCSDVAAQAGADPLEPWRRALERQQGSSDLPHVAAAFVLQWWCEVAATPITYAAELGPALLLTDGAGLGFELAPGLYPHRIVLDPARVRAASLSSAGSSGRNEPVGSAVLSTVPGEAPGSFRPLDPRRGRAAYGMVVSEVVRHFAPDVKMSSRQRWGVVDDTWATAVRLARGAAGETTGPEPRRSSCCFIYALPGMNECASCPRRA